MREQGLVGGLGVRCRLRLVAVVLAAVVVVSGCTSAENSEMLETYPELTDLQLAGTERIHRFVHSTTNSAFPTGNYIIQYYVPADGDVSFDDIIDEVVGVAQDKGWDLSYRERVSVEGEWYGCRPSLSDPNLGHYLTIYHAEADTSIDALERVVVDLTAGQAC